MPDHDLWWLSATELAALMRKKKVSPVELVDSVLERIDKLNPRLNAYVLINADQARREAKAAERALGKRGAKLGPLHGIPFGVKDVIDTHDMPTQYGSSIYACHRPRADAAAVALLREAGAILLGKTVTVELAGFHWSRTRNPHNLEHTPGGSSSGSGAAVADLMTPLALGTQTGGSTMRPAAFCGCPPSAPGSAR